VWPYSRCGCFGRRVKSVDRTGFQNQDHAACSVVGVLTVLLWLWSGGDADTTGKQERRKKGGERRRYKRSINKTMQNSLDTTLLIIYH